MERVFSKGIVVFEATTYLKKYGRQWLESHWCAKETPKTLPIDTLWLWERNYYRTFAWKGCEKGTIIGHLPGKVSRVCSLFLRWGSTIECSNRTQEIFSWPGTRRTWRFLNFPALFLSRNAYGTRRFRKPVAWPKADITESTLQSHKCERQVRARAMSPTIFRTMML